MKAVVTGASGFLGRHLVRALRQRGDAVVACTRRKILEFERIGAREIELDLADRAALEQACEGADVVFHVAAKTGVWGPRAEFIASNLRGTENVLAACRARGVARLVFTSSPSVVFDGRDHVRASNDLPYPRRYLCAYPETKAAAERLVLAANGEDGLATCALRPHLIIGADDPHLVPRIVQRARRGKLAIVGDGSNEVTLCAVENAVAAHVLAGATLIPSAPHAGKALFVGQDEPVNLWSWIGDLLRHIGIREIRQRLSAGSAYALGAACELSWNALRLAGEPPMTRFVALQLSRSHSYDMDPLRRALGYRQVISNAQATESVVRSLGRI